MILSTRVVFLPSVVLCLAGCGSSPEAMRSTEVPGAGTPTKIISAQSQEQPAAPSSAAVSARLREIAVGGRLSEMERPNFSDYRKNI